jgi:hypothetical protein
VSSVANETHPRYGSRSAPSNKNYESQILEYIIKTFLNIESIFIEGTVPIAKASGTEGCTLP